MNDRGRGPERIEKKIQRPFSLRKKNLRGLLKKIYFHGVGSGGKKFHFENFLHARSPRSLMVDPLGVE